jgi:hypothetical protein
MVSLINTATYIYDPSISGDKQPAINAAVVIVFAITGQRGALVSQMAQALPTLAMDHTRAQNGLTACGRKGRKEGAGQSDTKSGSNYWWSVLVRTKATPGEAVE